jgi:hypothetical protein
VIPQHISEFLRNAVKSTWALDVLRLLKNDPERTWTAHALTAELRGAMPMVTEILKDFQRWGLVIEDQPGVFRYPLNNALDATVSELLAIYSERPVMVIREIALSPNEKLQSFVDAFRMKKD